MDTIKTRLIHDQLSRKPADRKCVTCHTLPSPPSLLVDPLSTPPPSRRYRGFFHGVRTIVREQGIGGIYKGLTATILKQGAAVGGGGWDGAMRCRASVSP
jgi:hypothetical protein